MRAITPLAHLDRELRLATGLSVVEWCERSGVTPRMLDRALVGHDPFDVMAMLATELGVLPETLRAAA